jgi:hypothetical protein
MKTNAIKENPMQLATRNIFSLASKNSIAVFLFYYGNWQVSYGSIS